MAASLITPSCTWRRNAHAEEVIVDVAVLLVVVLKVLVLVVMAALCFYAVRLSDRDAR